MEEFRHKKGKNFSGPVDFFHVDIGQFFDFFFFQRSAFHLVSEPYVKKDLAHPAVESLVEGRKAIRRTLFFQFEENGEEPSAVGVPEIAPHNHHIEHVSAGLLHHFVEGRHIIQMEFFYDFPAPVQVLREEGMAVVGVEALNVVMPFCRNKHCILGKEMFQFLMGQHLVEGIFPFSLSFEVAAIVNQSQVVGVKIFPCPVHAGELTEVRILLGNIVTRIVLGISQIQRMPFVVHLPFRSHVKRKVHGILRHSVFLVCCYNNFDIHESTLTFLTILLYRQIISKYI